MTQVLMTYDNDTQEVDLAEDANGCISLEGGFETSTLISMHTNRRARPSDEEPQVFGWWGDSLADVQGDQIGSLLWLLARTNLTTATLRKAKLFISDAFRWYVDDGIAESVEVVTEREDPDMLKVQVRITRPNADPWEHIWRVHLNAV